ncbi:restriction endonuclease subunit S [Halomonas alkaliantarctica]|nr:restriction endonuclease subunit S [Halomonas alkaliantarctica]
MKWTQCELGDVVTFKSGGTPSKSDPELWGGDIPWVSTKELKSGCIYTTESRVTDKAIKNKKQLVEPGTVLIAVRGMVLAKAFPVSVAMRSMIFNQDIKAVIPRDGLLHEYLPYLLRGHHDELRALADEAAHGTKRIQTDRLLSFPIKLPPAPVQGCITAILSAYDDLIENNTRRIEILEEMARRLYEEWFVHFRFPGHEKVSFKESELGRVPEGWESGALQDVILLQRGFDLPVKKRTPGDFPIVSATGVSGTHVEAKVDGPGVITGRSGSIGKVMYVHGSYWPLNTTLWGKAFPLGSSLFAFYTLSAIDLKSFNVGAAVPTLNRNDIHGLPVAVPNKEIIASFDQAVGPIHKLMVTLEKKNSNLRAQRDMLLPKLVSGEIDLSDIPMPNDKEVEAA